MSGMGVLVVDMSTMTGTMSSVDELAENGGETAALSRARESGCPFETMVMQRSVAPAAGSVVPAAQRSVVPAAQLSMHDVGRVRAGKLGMVRP